MEEKPKIGVFIGRLQPVHNGHLTAIKLALQEMDHLVVALGSACQAKTIKNPWTTKERKEMLRSCFTRDERIRTSFVEVSDYLYNDNLWISSLQSSLSIIRMNSPLREVPIDDCLVTLYGHDKDRTTNYLHLFPKWHFRDTGKFGNIDGTKVREIFFRKDTLDLRRVCPLPVFDRLEAEIGTEEYQRLYDEYRHILNYKAAWSGAPFPPIFVTTDAVVLKSGHVLVVRRRGYPGKGLLALPGGFVKETEKLEDSCLRELKEETGIKIPKDELRKRISGVHVFDHPDRSLRGRTITHAYCINLQGGALPAVKGGDDAEKSFWMPLKDVISREEEFFEDHFHIINYFCHRG